MDKVRDVIEKNRKRKLTKHKELSNNTIIEIDNCSPLENLKLQKNLKQIAEKEQIAFDYGKGRRKPEIQQLYKELENCGECLMGYKECFEIMEKDGEKNKVMKINEQWETLKEESHANIQSEKRSLNRQIRSIQTEGHLGDIRENENFRRFNYRDSEKVY